MTTTNHGNPPPEPTRAPVCVCCGRRLPRVRRSTPPLRVLAGEYPGLPVSEMLTRGWLGDSETITSADDLRERVMRFFDADTASELRQLLRLA